MSDPWTSDHVPQSDMNERPSVLREAQANAVHDARTTRLLSRPVASWAITMGLGGLFLGFVGATDSYELPLFLRLGLWLGLCSVAGVIAITIERAVMNTRLRSRSVFTQWAVLTASLAIAMVPVIFLVNSTGSYSPIASLPQFTINSFVISAALVAFRLLIGALLAGSVSSGSTSEMAEDAQEFTEPPPKLLERLKPGLQNAKLLALKSDGHYLRVFTDQGSELILMRLKDAMGETAPVEGMQVHRSWWLARRPQIERSTKDGRIELKRDKDTWVPVS
ncbi:MAG: LytTR family transcriptional regulator [Erythrobacter sp.]|nr:LytTR family transcriptional regulator [Erythrobacter sp.]